MKWVWWCVLAPIIGCQTFDREAEIAKILQVHHAQRAHHFNKDSIGFANQLTSDFLSVNRGRLQNPAFEENVTRYHGYFNAVRFLQWDDNEEPIIRFSDDGKLAYTIVQKTLELKFPDGQGDSLVETTEFVWTSIYRKIDGVWKIESVASTNKPSTYLPGPEERLRKQLARFDQAFVAADTAKLADMITPDYTHTNRERPPIGKDQWFDFISSRKKDIDSGKIEVLSYETSNIKITLLDQTAIVNARVDIQQKVDGKPMKVAYQVTHVWKNEEGIWMRAAFHDGKIL